MSATLRFACQAPFLLCKFAISACPACDVQLQRKLAELEQQISGAYSEKERAEKNTEGMQFRLELQQGKVEELEGTDKAILPRHDQCVGEALRARVAVCRAAVGAAAAGKLGGGHAHRRPHLARVAPGTGAPDHLIHMPVPVARVT